MRKFFVFLLFAVLTAFLFYSYPLASQLHFFPQFLINAILYNSLLILVSYAFLKKSAKGLTAD